MNQNLEDEKKYFNLKRMKRRGRLMILMNILEVISKESVHTRIMMKARLYMQTFVPPLNFLLEKGLVKLEMRKRGKQRKLKKRYFLTDKGYHVLKSWNFFKSILSELQW